MSKVKKITVSNLKALSSLTADFNGCTAIITGGNNKGKTSFLKALPDRLKQVKPEAILKEGTDEGFAEWELTTGEKLIWKFDNKTKAGEKLIFVTKDNIKTSLTKEISDRYFPKGFDIDKFLQDSPKKQRETLQKIVGIDFTEIDERYAKAYEDRTFANRSLEAQKSKLSEIDKTLPTEAIDTLDLQKELAGIDSHNDKYEYVSKGVDDKINLTLSIDAEIERLKSLISLEQDKIKSLNIDIKKGEEWLSVKSNQPKTKDLADEITEKIDRINIQNKKIKDNNEAIEVNKEFAILQEVSNNADALVKSIDKEKVEVIKKAKLPEGFGFTDSGVTYMGLDFSKEQLSSSAIYIGALKLASLNIGEVKTLHFDASYLDKNSLSDIEKWAQENDLQLLIERPDFDGGEIEYHLYEG